MKLSRLSLLLLLVAGSAAPLRAAPLPASIQKIAPKNVVSLGLFHTAFAPDAPKFLIHAWVAPRKSAYSRATSQDALITEKDVRLNRIIGPSPFVLDIFSDAKTPRYLTSVVYLSTRNPQRIEARYLNAKTKKGLVFEVLDGYEKLTSQTYFVFQDDLSEEPRTTSIQHAWSGGTDDSFTMQNARNGKFQLLHLAERYGKNSREILKWNGHEFTRRK